MIAALRFPLGRPAGCRHDAYVRRGSARAEKSLVVMQIVLLTYFGKDPDQAREKACRSERLRRVPADFSGVTAATAANDKGMHGEE
jgi:hypothetical protein